MTNELKILYMVVSTVYVVLLLTVSLIAIRHIPDAIVEDWVYFVCSGVVMGLVYILFKMKYYHLHEEYLRSLKSDV